MLYQKFYKIVSKQLDRQIEEEAANIEKAAEYCAKSVMAGRVIHTFGTGHSQMFGMEIAYRTGSIIPVNALLIPQHAIYPRAKLSTELERVEGFSNAYLQLENTDEKDTMIIVSMSGRNASSVDMAMEAKKIGMKVIALTSKAFSGAVSSRHSSNKKLMDVADVVIDIKCIAGDAVLEVEGLDDKVSSTSTILGMMTMQLIMTQTIENCVEAGFKPPVYVSSNLDRGDEINKKNMEKYASIINYL